jgi:hypothetical protein
MSSPDPSVPRDLKSRISKLVHKLNVVKGISFTRLADCVGRCVTHGDTHGDLDFRNGGVILVATGIFTHIINWHCVLHIIPGCKLFRSRGLISYK